MTRSLPLRARLALLTAVAVAVAVAAASLACWVITRNQLRDQLDSSLKSDRGAGAAVQLAETFGCADALSNSGQRKIFDALNTVVQIVSPDGRHCLVQGSTAVTVQQSDTAVASGAATTSLHDGKTADDTSMRIYTSRTADGYAVSIARPLTEINNSLSSLAILLVTVTAGGVVAAATAGLVIARTALRPVETLTGAVEHIARTEDLDTQIPVRGKDEIARLSRSFNSMTAALAGSRERQQQLIADAGHELRTPLTSLRTNVDLLLRSEESRRELPPEDRRTLLLSVKAQMKELSSLIGDVLELSRRDAAAESGPVQVVALHEVAGRALERARLRGIGLEITDDISPWYVWGDPASLERAVVNLLDNAVKFSPPGGSIQVRLAGGELTVRDHGPGIAAEEAPLVFDRFWRSPSARSLPGSGLGLSIVARTVRLAGGQVALEPAPGGGAIARMVLPGADHL